MQIQVTGTEVDLDQVTQNFIDLVRNPTQFKPLEASGIIRELLEAANFKIAGIELNTEVGQSSSFGGRKPGSTAREIYSSHNPTSKCRVVDDILTPTCRSAHVALQSTNWLETAWGKTQYGVTLHKKFVGTGREPTTVPHYTDEQIRKMLKRHIARICPLPLLCITETNDLLRFAVQFDSKRPHSHPAERNQMWGYLGSSMDRWEYYYGDRETNLPITKDWGSHSVDDGIGTHVICGRNIHLVASSPTHNALRCACNLRIPVPITIATCGDLINHFQHLQ